MAGKVAVVAGYGTGISAAVGRKFGSQGFHLALLARTASRLDAAVADFKAEGITAKAYPRDLTDSAAVKATITAVHSDLGPIDLLFWNPVSTPAPLLTATPEQLVAAYDVTVTGLVAAVQAAHADLKAQSGAVLVTGGGLALETDDMAAAAANWGIATLGIAKAAQRKLVHIMHKSLAADGVYVAEVTVMGGVKAKDKGETHATITPELVADDLWELYSKRDPAVWFVKRS